MFLSTDRVGALISFEMLQIIVVTLSRWNSFYRFFLETLTVAECSKTHPNNNMEAAHLISSQRVKKNKETTFSNIQRYIGL